MKFPEQFSTIDKLDYLERMVLLHSIIYYELNESVISDIRFNRISNLLAKKVQKYQDTKILRKTLYGYVFNDYTDGSTGFHLIRRLKKKDKEYLEILASHVIHESKKHKKRKHK